MHNLAKEFIAELIGTAILMLLGVSGAASGVLSRSSTSSLQCAFAYAFGVVIASAFAGPISGAHINPAFTVAFSVIGKFKWRKIPIYLLAQYLGSFIGCFLAWSIYFEAIQGYDTVRNRTTPSINTAAIFVTFPSQYTTIWPAIWDQVISTGLLAFAVLYLGDESLYQTPKMLQIFSTGFVILTFITGFGYNCGAILNPARDLAPRVLLWMVGYKQIVFEPLNYNFWWAVGIVGPHLGAIIGSILYHYTAKMRLSYAEEQMQQQSISAIQTKSIALNSAEPAIMEQYSRRPKLMNPGVANRQIYGTVNSEFAE